jgi:hypothetical protein
MDMFTITYSKLPIAEFTSRCLSWRLILIGRFFGLPGDRYRETSSPNIDVLGALRYLKRRHGMLQAK